MKNLTELITTTRGADESFEEIVVPANAIEVRDEELSIEGRSWHFGVDAHIRAYGAATAPRTFLSELSPSTQAVVITEILQRGDFGQRVNVAVRGNEVFTVSRGDLNRLRRHEVLSAVMEALGEDAHSLTPTRIGIDVDALEIDLATPRKSIDVRKGDTVQAGFHISHSIFSERASVVEMFTYRLVCTNGMTHRSCPSSQSRAERTRKLPLDHPNGKELQKAQIRRLVSEIWARHEPLLVELRATRERRADVEGVLTGWLQRARISTESMMPRLREAWQQDGGDNTQYAAINALTRVATHNTDLSVRQRRVLASLAGLLSFSHVHICPRCFTVLSQAAISGEDS